MCWWVSPTLRTLAHRGYSSVCSMSSSVSLSLSPSVCGSGSWRSCHPDDRECASRSRLYQLQSRRWVAYSIRACELGNSKSPGSLILSRARVEGGMYASAARAQRSARKTGKFSAAEVVETFAEVGVVHLALDDAERDPRITAHDEDLANGVARYPLGAGVAGRGSRLHEGQRADAGDDRAKAIGVTASLRNSSSAAIRPAQIISIRSQGTQWVGSPRRPSIRNPSLRQAARWTVRGGAQLGKLVGAPCLGRDAAS